MSSSSSSSSSPPISLPTPPPPPPSLYWSTCNRQLAFTLDCEAKEKIYLSKPGEDEVSTGGGGGGGPRREGDRRGERWFYGGCCYSVLLFLLFLILLIRLDSFLAISTRFQSVLCLCFFFCSTINFGIWGFSVCCCLCLFPISSYSLLSLRWFFLAGTTLKKNKNPARNVNFELETAPVFNLMRLLYIKKNQTNLLCGGFGSDCVYLKPMKCSM